MKYNRLAVYLENKKGDMYLLNINQNEMDVIYDVIAQLQNNKIKYFDKKSPLSFVKKNNMNTEKELKEIKKFKNNKKLNDKTQLKWGVDKCISV